MLSNRKSRGRRASEDSYSESEDGAHFVAGGAKDAAVGPLSAEAREALELAFERTLQDYDDEEVGYMDHVSLTYSCSVCAICGANMMLLCSVWTAAGRGGLRWRD